MESDKKIVGCTSCGTLVRIPSDKHLRFKCPNCGKENEYRYGELVDKLSNANTKNVINESNNEVKDWKSKTTSTYAIIGFVLLLMIVGAIYFSIPHDNKEDEKNQDNSLVNKDSVDNSPAAIFNKKLWLERQDDSIMEKQFRDLSQELKDTTLKKILSKIQENSSNENWAKANRWFDKTLDILNHSGRKGSSLINEFQSPIAKLKIWFVSRDTTAGIFSPMQSVDKSGVAKSFTSLYITNKTEYPLMIYYSGPENKVVSLQPHSSQSVRLVNGTYSTVGEVSAEAVSNYRGTTIADGFEYTSDFFIQEMTYYR